MSKLKDELLGHADDNDGIDEYDNPLPDWWLGLFFFCILWAFGYAIDFHFISKRSQVAWYEAEVAYAAQAWPVSEDAGKVVMTPEAIAAGEAIYVANCAACHGADLTGGIGPNLIDDEWIHGGTAEDIARTVTDGVPEKGMVTWGPILGPERVAQVTAFIMDRGAH